MKNHLCEACQNIGQTRKGQCLDDIYQNMHPQKVRLCYGHSVELFKIGQKNFLSKYGEDLVDTTFRPERPDRLKNFFVFS